MIVKASSTLLSFLVACSVLLCPPGLARAEEESPQARAEQLFQDAIVLMKADHCRDAVPRFLESQQLDPSAATLLNLATCYVRLGKTASAWRAYRRAAESAVLERDEAIGAQADKAIAMLEPKLTRLRVVAPRGPEALSVKVNGETVGGNGVEVPLDPGENFLEALAPGREPWRRTVSAQGQGAMIVIEVPELGATPARPEPPAPPPAAEPPKPRRAILFPVAVAVGTVGVGGIVLGMVMGLSAKSAYDDSNPDCVGGHCNQAGHDLRETAHDRAAIATWATVLGVAAVGTGVVLWVVSDRNGEGRRVSINPWFRPGHTAMGLAMEGRL